MRLHCFVHDAVHHLARVKFGLRGACARFRGMRVLQPRRIMRQAARGLDLRLHIRNHPLNGLKLANVFAKGLALLRVLDGFFQRPLREADSLRGDPDAPAIQRAESNLQPLPFFSQTIFHRHHAIVQQNLHRWRRPLPHFVLMPPHAKPGKTWFNEKRADAFAARRRIGFRKHNQHACGVSVRHPGFCSVELVAIANAHGTRLNSGSIGTRGRLRQAKRSECFAGGHAPQIFFLLRFRAKQQQRRLHRGIRHAQRGRHRRKHARDFFQHQRIRDSVESRPTPFFRHQHAAAAHFAEFLDGLGRKFLRLLPFFDERAHFRVHELADGIANQFLVVVKRKIHQSIVRVKCFTLAMKKVRMMLTHEVSEDVVSEGVVLLERFKSSRFKVQKNQSKNNAETQSTQRKRTQSYFFRGALRRSAINSSTKEVPGFTYLRTSR